MGKYEKLVGNSIVFLVGNVGSKSVNFLFVPLYTYWLSTTEYGVIDTLIITASLLGPFASLSVHEALFRFALEDKSKTKDFYTASIFVCCFGAALFSLCYFLFQSVQILRPYFACFYVYMILNNINGVQMALIRGIERNKLYSTLGVLLTLLQVGGVLFFVAYLKQGVKGYFAAWNIALAAVILLSVFTTASWAFFCPASFNAVDVRNMLKYSVPLVPNAVMWWIINSSDKYMIMYFISAGANGVFSVAAKVPTVIIVIYHIFLMAWQISAIDEYKSKDRAAFYGGVYKCLVAVLFVFTSGMFVLLKPLVFSLFEQSYHEAYRYMPMLLIGAVFSSLAGYFGTFYVAYRKTEGALKTSAACAVINIIMNYILLRSFGVLGVSVSMALSFFALYVYRLIDTRTLAAIPSEIKTVSADGALLIVQTICLFRFDGAVLFATETAAFCLMFFINREMLIKILRLIFTFYGRNKHAQNSI